MEIDKKLFEEIALEVQKEFWMWWLAWWLYQDYAEEILKKYINLTNKL